jgi:hypothetical protein
MLFIAFYFHNLEALEISSVIFRGNLYGNFIWQWQLCQLLGPHGRLARPQSRVVGLFMFSINLYSRSCQHFVVDMFGAACIAFKLLTA